MHGFHRFLANLNEMCGTVCACPTPTDMRRQYDIPRVSGSRFPSRGHALNSLEYISDRFGDFNFLAKIKIFQKFFTIHDLDAFRPPRVSVRHPAHIFALRSSRRPRGSPGAALAAPDDQTLSLVPTTPECSPMMLGRPRGPGDAPFASRRTQQPLDKKSRRFSSIKKKQNYIYSYVLF